VAPEIGVGSELAGYRIIRELGKGGMGAVYLAERIATGEMVAFKVLLSEVALNEEFRARFDRESRYASALDHPNIVRVHEVGGTDELSYMVMDYVDGSDLATKLAQEGPLETAQIIRILEQVAAALDAVHATGLFHRDVKPANVVIGSRDGSDELRCYLTDFGLSKRPSQDSRPLTAFGFFVGTLDYTAPEQIQGATLDPRVDVYSLGCLLYECLTGQPPFQRPREEDVLYAHLQDPPPKVTERRPDLTAQIDDVVAKAMAKAPEERYATCTAMVDDARVAIVPAMSAPVAGGLRLRVTRGNAEGSTIEVDDELLIGRGAHDEGRLADDIEISRQHARISRAQGGHVIEDLGSTNGTILNGRRINATEILGVGDEIEVGGTTLVVHAAPAGVIAESQPAEPGMISLSLRFDPDAGEVGIKLGGESEQIRLLHEEGRWHFTSGGGLD